jgi:hypothetical protein
VKTAAKTAVKKAARLAAPKAVYWVEHLAFRMVAQTAARLE